jgi:hypothetical protein
MEKILAHATEADSEIAAGSREPSPVTGEGRRLGDSSHNGSSSAYPVGRVHLVGDGGSLLSPNQDRHQETGSLQKSIETVSNSNDDLPSYSEYEPTAHAIPIPTPSPPIPVGDEGVDMDYEPGGYGQWAMVREQSWGFNQLPAQSMQPPNSDVDDMFGAERNSSNDSTRVEGNAGSVASDEGFQDTPMFSDANQDEGNVRSMRESAPAPDFVPAVAVTQDVDDEDDLPVAELHAGDDGDLTFTNVDK